MIWNGTQEDARELERAIARNCACEYGSMGVAVVTCPPHRMLAEDQRALNGLLFMRQFAHRLRREEFAPGSPPGRLFAEHSSRARRNDGSDGV